ncbi:hypothetical protein Dacet_1854 [Denitrovibrio acetiphilus DSM 12809]|uniref:Uncharacterized protein n=1 Tax=Denitrovibrio acetiphilus (strain DSM 12809 / NBRC 114555 / N2460) TaxID=522772 RepID=D4H0V5_DENA2|nr:hypothetical protein [Denitrovibrio acetiphilus]ADD68618.1 hypothetical protein Dacet_1854 [Denitrovibrio acetiphilus DSM 12809]
MSQKIMTLFALVLSAVLIAPLSVSAGEDDYIVGLSAFRDGLYEISAPTLESYLGGETDKRKADYAHYLLYRIYMADKDYQKSLAHLKAVDDVVDRRFEREQMTRDMMIMLTKTDCSAASAYLVKANDEDSINYYLDSECKPDESAAKIIIENATETGTKLKVVSEFSDKPVIVGSVFDSIDPTTLDAKTKKYFALYFYKNGDMERFSKVRAVYEDSDVVGLDLDRMWQAGEKESFIAGFEKFKDKYELAGANACRAIDIYKKSEKPFDCDLINECMQEYSVEFVQVKGACLVKAGDKEKVTAFIDSLKPAIFSGMCSYGEYIFYNELYTGKSESKFYQCEERYKIAEILMRKEKYQSVVNMFFKKEGDMDKFYTASAFRKLGKTDVADSTASGIKDESLKATYNGGTQ